MSATLPAVLLTYRLLLILLSPLLLLYFFWFSLRKKQIRFFWQRLGLALSGLPEKSLWIHCASVGESITVMPLVHSLLAQHATLNIVITTNTVTGAKIIHQQSLPRLFHCYLPFDWSFSTKRFLRKIKPLTLLVVETEIWPNLFYQCARQNCPVHIINARLSIKTTATNAWVKALLGCALSFTRQIHARSEMDRDAYLQLGADADKLRVAGNLKYSKKPKPKQTTALFKRDFILLASSHDNEEILITQCWQNIRHTISNRNELLLIAPRHPERCPDITHKLKQQWPDINIAIHSQQAPVSASTDIYLLDTVGELINYFPQAKLVIMGGSFVNIGGHNILEPAQFGCATLCGPYMHNFKEEVALLLEKNALLQVKDIRQLEQCLTQLLTTPETVQLLQKNAAEISEDFNHILGNYVHCVEQILEI